MSIYSEYTTEYLNCVNRNKEGNKYIYKYKYYGHANGILSIYVPHCVYFMIIQADENFHECRFIGSAVNHNYKLVLCDDCKNIDFSQIKKFNVTIYASDINPPEIKITCEYIFDRKSNNIPINTHLGSISPSSLPGSSKFGRSNPKSISRNSSNHLIFMMSPSSHSGE